MAATGNTRIQAYEVLESKTKAKMCQFAAMGKECRKQKTGECQFAHTKEEQAKFSGLADSRKETIKKTRMCANIQTSGRCPHGKKCSFAHTREELRLPMCLFGSGCKTMGSTGNPCAFVHPNETPESYRLRTGRPHPHDDVIVTKAPDDWKAKCDALKEARAAAAKKAEEDHMAYIRAEMMKEDARLAARREEEAKMPKKSWADICEEEDQKQDSVEQLTAQVSQLKIEKEEDDEEEEEEEESDDEDDGVKIILHNDFPDATGITLGMGGKPPIPHYRDARPHPVQAAYQMAQPMTKITATFTPEQFAFLFPTLVQMGVAFSTSQ